MNDSEREGAPARAHEADESALTEIVRRLRAHDTHGGRRFAHFKDTAVLRGVERRMKARSIASARDYATLLDGDGGERERLASELLVPATSFFRDGAAFDALGGAIATMLADVDDTVARAWVVGCATGEEAYSIAILLNERVTASGRPLGVRVFATDIDPAVIATARRGSYAASAVARLDRDRLRWFEELGDGTDLVRVVPALRDDVVFAHHDVLAAPPPSKLDLVSCRNVLIYLEPQLHEGLLATFHRALRPHGLLFLGASETPSTSPMFDRVDDEWKIYRRRDEAEPRARELTRRSFASPRQGHVFTHGASTAERAPPRAAPAYVDDLTGANAALRAALEELEATAEELETSVGDVRTSAGEVEELEEALRATTADLARVTDEMANVLGATGTGAAFLDGELRLRGFAGALPPGTRLASKELGLRVDECVWGIDHAVGASAAEVLRTLVPKDIDVAREGGGRCRLRVSPYRTAENTVDGLVITFTDVGAPVAAQEREGDAS